MQRRISIHPSHTQVGDTLADLSIQIKHSSRTKKFLSSFYQLGFGQGQPYSPRDRPWRELVDVDENENDGPTSHVP